VFLNQVAEYEEESCTYCIFVHNTCRPFTTHIPTQPHLHPFLNHNFDLYHLCAVRDGLAQLL
jgi:hypothetical protein